MCFKITSIPVRIGIIRKIRTNQAGMDVGKQIYVLLQETNESSLLEVSQKPRIGLPYGPTLSLLCYTQRI